MKTINLNVDLKFSDDISNDNEIIEVVHNVLNALVTTSMEFGISPDNSEGMVNKIIVLEPYTETKLEYTLGDVI